MNAKNVILALLAVLAIAMFVASGGDDRADLESHGRWMAEAKDSGAAVMW